MIGGIILTHGTIGEALLEAASSILGEVNDAYALSTATLSMQRLNIELKQILSERQWSGGAIIMVSLMGGSCWNSAVAVARQLPRIEVVSGVNLSMLLSFFTKRDHYEISELAEIIKEDGIRGICKFAIGSD